MFKGLCVFVFNGYLAVKAVYPGEVYFYCARCGFSQGVSSLVDMIRSRCPRCSGLLVVRYVKPVFNVDPGGRGVWRYFRLLPCFENRVTLGEGLTRLSHVDGVLVKNERFNPTGSYADRASALIASFIADAGVRDVVIEYAPEFTKSLVTYLARVPGVTTRVYAESLLEVDSEDAVFFASSNIGVEVKPGGSGFLVPYLNPLTVEGLKTIVFELVEQGVDADYVVVPSKTGVLAASAWKGILDLEDAGCDVGFEVVAAVPRGRRPPVLEDIRGVRVVEVSEEELYESYKTLVRRGFAIKPLAALGYHVARSLGKAVAVVTMGFKPRATRRTSSVRKLVLEVLSKRPLLTAYEIWKENPVYTLRAVYKAVKSMEASGELCYEVITRGSRKVKLYKLCE